MLDSRGQYGQSLNKSARLQTRASNLAVYEAAKDKIRISSSRNKSGVQTPGFEHAFIPQNMVDDLLEGKGAMGNI
jgi:hypothetical protein